MTDTPEKLLETGVPRRNVQGNQSQEAKGSQRECERFYIGEGVSVLKPPGLDSVPGSGVKMGDVVDKPFLESGETTRGSS